MGIEDSAGVALKVQPTVIIMRGWPGLGKSTLARRVCMDWVDGQYFGPIPQTDYKVCSADHFHMDAFGDYRWKPENVGRAHEYCRNVFWAATATGVKLVVVDNTNIKRKDYQYYVAVGRTAGYKITQLVPDTSVPLEECIRRNVHNVPPQTIERMKREFEIDSELEHFVLPPVPQSVSTSTNVSDGFCTRIARRLRAIGGRY